MCVEGIVKFQCVYECMAAFTHSMRSGPFGGCYVSYREDSLIMAPTNCRNCRRFNDSDVCILVPVMLAVQINFYTLHHIFIYLLSILHNVSTPFCVHLTIILSFSSSFLCHSILLPLIPFSHQSSNPFRPGKFMSTSFSSSRLAPFHNFFW